MPGKSAPARSPSVLKSGGRATSTVKDMKEQGKRNFVRLESNPAYAPDSKDRKRREQYTEHGKYVAKTPADAAKKAGKVVLASKPGKDKITVLIRERPFKAEDPSVKATMKKKVFKYEVTKVKLAVPKKLSFGGVAEYTYEVKALH